MRILLFLLMSITATPVFALSCMPYNAVQAFIDADEATAQYVVVEGKVTFNPANLPKQDFADQASIKPDNIFSGNVTGKMLTKRGFTEDFSTPIMINVQCFGPWCGGLTAGANHLVYLKKTKDTYLLETNPCGGFSFENPSKNTLRKLKNCINGRRCKAGLPTR